MTARTITFRVYRDVPGYGSSSAWTHKVGPDLVVSYDSAAKLPVILLTAVDPNPVQGAVYTVTAQADAVNTDYDASSSIMLLAVGP